MKSGLNLKSVFNFVSSLKTKWTIFVLFISMKIDKYHCFDSVIWVTTKLERNRGMDYTENTFQDLTTLKVSQFLGMSQILNWETKVRTVECE